MLWEGVTIRKKEQKNNKMVFVTYGNLKIINGKISDNKFKIPRTGTQAVQWCLMEENKKNIKTTLNKYMRDSSLFSGDVEECFIYVLNYFQSPDKVFYKNYVENSSEYSIDKYVFSNLKYAFNIYKSDILKKSTSSLNSNEETTNSESQTYSILNSLAEESFLKTQDGLEKNEMYKQNYTELKTSFENFLIKNHYNKTYLENTDTILINLFLKRPSEKLDVNIRRVAETSSLSFEGITFFLEDLKIKFSEGNEEAMSVYKSLKEILL